MTQRKKRAFTLLEMLIVVSVLGILAAVLIPKIQGAQARSRDAKRKVDLLSIHNALKIFMMDYSVYPSGSNASIQESYETNRYVFSWHTVNPRISGLQTIMGTVPKDPTNSYNPSSPGGTAFAGPFYTGNINYSYGNVFRKSSSYRRDYFDLWAQLENPQDPLRNSVMNYTYNYNNLPLYPGNHALMFSISPSSPYGP